MRISTINFHKSHSKQLFDIKNASGNVECVANVWVRRALLFMQSSFTECKRWNVWQWRANFMHFDFTNWGYLSTLKNFTRKNSSRHLKIASSALKYLYARARGSRHLWENNLVVVVVIMFFFLQTLESWWKIDESSITTEELCYSFGTIEYRFQSFTQRSG